MIIKRVYNRFSHRFNNTNESVLMCIDTLIKLSYFLKENKNRMTWNLNGYGFWNTKYIKDWFNENRDHSYLYNKWDEIWEFIKSKWMRVWECDFELTAENMCKFILKQFRIIWSRGIWNSNKFCFTI